MRQLFEFVYLWVKGAMLVFMFAHGGPLDLTRPIALAGVGVVVSLLLVNTGLALYKSVLQKRINLT